MLKHVPGNRSPSSAHQREVDRDTVLHSACVAKTVASMDLAFGRAQATASSTCVISNHFPVGGKIEQRKREENLQSAAQSDSRGYKFLLLDVITPLNGHYQLCHAHNHASEEAMCTYQYRPEGLDQTINATFHNYLTFSS